MECVLTVKQVLKRFLGVTADVFIRASKVLPRRIEAHISISPTIAAKSYPYRHESYVLLKPRIDVEMPCENGLPIPPKEYWFPFMASAEEYLSSGRDHVEKMKRITEASGFSFREGKRILDFGCAAGRMLRWLKDDSKECEIWGVDIRAEFIAWCQRHLSPPFRFGTTTTFPHLPFEDGYFDLIYAGGVFTEISDLSDAWLLELRRVLAPGGKLYVTIHDRHSVDLILKFPPNHRLYWLKELLLSFEQETHFMEADFAMFITPRTSFLGPQVFYDTHYFCQNCEHFFKVLSVTPEAYWFLTAILLEK